MGLTTNGKRIGMAAHLERVDFRQSLEDDYQRQQQINREQVEKEIIEICEWIRPFFDKEMWDRFVDAGPDRGFLQYVRAEWHRIAEEFEISDPVGL